jgi:hypothetical protein
VLRERARAWRDLLDGHSVLDIECLDRIYLNAYVPILQSSGRVVAFMTQHLGKPIPSPALMEHIGTLFRKAVLADVGDEGAAQRLAGLLAERGDLDGLRARADAGDDSVAPLLPELLIKQGRGEEAERLRRFGLNPDGSIACA